MKTQYKSGDVISINVVIIDNDVPKQAVADAIVREVFSSEILSIEVFSISKEKATGLMYITPDRIIKPVGNDVPEPPKNPTYQVKQTRNYRGSVRNYDDNSKFNGVLDSDWFVSKVLRISDGEEFGIGDILDLAGRIESILWINVVDDGVTLQTTGGGEYAMDFAVKKKPSPPRKKIFQTEDGVDIYPGDKYIYVDKFWSIHECPGASGENKTSKKFSTRAAAKEYIVWNKPCLSFTDVEIYLDPAAMRPLQDFIRKKLGL